MPAYPKTITADQIAEVIAAKFKRKDEITCYVGSNAATPTTSLEALTESIQSRTTAPALYQNGSFAAPGTGTLCCRRSAGSGDDLFNFFRR